MQICIMPCQDKSRFRYWEGCWLGMMASLFSTSTNHWFKSWFIKDNNAVLLSLMNHNLNQWLIICNNICNELPQKVWTLIQLCVTCLNIVKYCKMWKQKANWNSVTVHHLHYIYHDIICYYRFIYNYPISMRYCREDMWLSISIYISYLVKLQRWL